MQTHGRRYSNSGKRQRQSVNAVAQVHQRVDGEARIAFRRHPDGRTRLADLYQRAPCRVMFPETEPDEPLQAVLLTTGGGLTGGDRANVAVTIAPGGQATLTTQAAEKICRALPATSEARGQGELQIGPAGWADWRAQETFVFEGSRLRRSFAADVAPSGKLLAVESIVFGRTAMGEHFDTGLLHDAWRISRGGKLIWADALHLEGDVRQLRTDPFAFGTSVACSPL